MRVAPLLWLFAIGCGSSQGDAVEPAVSDPAPSREAPVVTDAPPPSETPSAHDARAADDPPATPRAPSGADDPRISRSAGEPGGIVLLWPRVAGSGDIAPAADVQASLRAMVERAATGRQLDVRPEPERVCPQAGCQGHAVGALLLHTGTGCAVVLTVAPPGRSSTRLLPWVGQVELRQSEVPFRQPPEGALRILDFTPCADLVTELESSAPQLEATLRAALR